MKLGAENRKQIIVAIVLVVVLVGILAYQFIPSSSTIASAPPGAPASLTPVAATGHPPHRGDHHGPPAGKKDHAAPNAVDSLDPTLHLGQLAATERIKYEGSGRNIFVAEAEPIPRPLFPGATDHGKPTEQASIYHAPPTAPAPPIPLKFFGFASQPGEAKKIFLSKGDDVFIAGEGDIVDRRYKVVKISAAAVDIQDVVNSGPPQSIPLTQGS